MFSSDSVNVNGPEAENWANIYTRFVYQKKTSVRTTTVPPEKHFAGSVSVFSSEIVEVNSPRSENRTGINTKFIFKKISVGPRSENRTGLNTKFIYKKISVRLTTSSPNKYYAGYVSIFPSDNTIVAGAGSENWANIITKSG